jgi:EAL domain-containing protein (putative c-di-GMP-specific phosphodiesterase class I)
MCVVAEGVEVQNQLDYLIKYDCDKIQGFLFCKPVPEEDIIKLLKE